MLADSPPNSDFYTEVPVHDNDDPGRNVILPAAFGFRKLIISQEWMTYISESMTWLRQFLAILEKYENFRGNQNMTFTDFYLGIDEDTEERAILHRVLNLRTEVLSNIRRATMTYWFNATPFQRRQVANRIRETCVEFLNRQVYEAIYHNAVNEYPGMANDVPEIATQRLLNAAVIGNHRPNVDQMHAWLRERITPIIVSENFGGHPIVPDDVVPDAPVGIEQKYLENPNGSEISSSSQGSQRSRSPSPQAQPRRQRNLIQGSQGSRSPSPRAQPRPPPDVHQRCQRIMQQVNLLHRDVLQLAQLAESLRQENHCGRRYEKAHDILQVRAELCYDFYHQIEAPIGGPYGEAELDKLNTCFHLFTALLTDFHDDIDMQVDYMVSRENNGQGADNRRFSYHGLLPEHGFGIADALNQWESPPASPVRDPSPLQRRRDPSRSLSPSFARRRLRYDEYDDYGRPRAARPDEMDIDPPMRRRRRSPAVAAAAAAAAAAAPLPMRQRRGSAAAGGGARPRLRRGSPAASPPFLRRGSPAAAGGGGGGSDDEDEVSSNSDSDSESQSDRSSASSDSDRDSDNLQRGHIARRIADLVREIRELTAARNNALELAADNNTALQQLTIQSQDIIADLNRQLVEQKGDPDGPEAPNLQEQIDTLRGQFERNRLQLRQAIADYERAQDECRVLTAQLSRLQNEHARELAQSRELLRQQQQATQAEQARHREILVQAEARVAEAARVLQAQLEAARRNADANLDRIQNEADAKFRQSQAELDAARRQLAEDQRLLRQLQDREQELRRTADTQEEQLRRQNQLQIQEMQQQNAEATQRLQHEQQEQLRALAQAHVQNLRRAVEEANAIGAASAAETEARVKRENAAERQALIKKFEEERRALKLQLRDAEAKQQNAPVGPVRLRIFNSETGREEERKTALQKRMLDDSQDRNLALESELADEKRRHWLTTQIAELGAEQIAELEAERELGKVEAYEAKQAIESAAALEVQIARLCEEMRQMEAAKEAAQERHNEEIDTIQERLRQADAVIRGEIGAPNIAAAGAAADDGGGAGGFRAAVKKIEAEFKERERRLIAAHQERESELRAQLTELSSREAVGAVAEGFAEDQTAQLQTLRMENTRMREILLAQRGGENAIGYLDQLAADGNLEDEKRLEEMLRAAVAIDAIGFDFASSRKGWIDYESLKSGVLRLIVTIAQMKKMDEAKNYDKDCVRIMIARFQNASAIFAGAEQERNVNLMNRARIVKFKIAADLVFEIMRPMQSFQLLTDAEIQSRINAIEGIESIKVPVWNDQNRLILSILIAAHTEQERLKIEKSVLPQRRRRRYKDQIAAHRATAGFLRVVIMQWYFGQMDVNMEQLFGPDGRDAHFEQDQRRDDFNRLPFAARMAIDRRLFQPAVAAAAAGDLEGGGVVVNPENSDGDDDAKDDGVFGENSDDDADVELERMPQQEAAGAEAAAAAVELEQRAEAASKHREFLAKHRPARVLAEAGGGNADDMYDEYLRPMNAEEDAMLESLVMDDGIGIDMRACRVAYRRFPHNNGINSLDGVRDFMLRRVSCPVPSFFGTMTCTESDFDELRTLYVRYCNALAIRSAVDDATVEQSMANTTMYKMMAIMLFNLMDDIPDATQGLISNADIHSIIQSMYPLTDAVVFDFDELNRAILGYLIAAEMHVNAHGTVNEKRFEKTGLKKTLELWYYGQIDSPLKQRFELTRLRVNRKRGVRRSQLPAHPHMPAAAAGAAAELVDDPFAEPHATAAAAAAERAADKRAAAELAQRQQQEEDAARERLFGVFLDDEYSHPLNAEEDDMLESLVASDGIGVRWRACRIAHRNFPRNNNLNSLEDVKKFMLRKVTHEVPRFFGDMTCTASDFDQLRILYVRYMNAYAIRDGGARHMPIVRAMANITMYKTMAIMLFNLMSEIPDDAAALITNAAIHRAMHPSGSVLQFDASNRAILGYLINAEQAAGNALSVQRNNKALQLETEGLAKTLRMWYCGQMDAPMRTFLEARIIPRSNVANNRPREVPRPQHTPPAAAAAAAAAGARPQSPLMRIPVTDRSLINDSQTEFDQISGRAILVLQQFLQYYLRKDLPFIPSGELANLPGRPKTEDNAQAMRDTQDPDAVARIRRMGEAAFELHASTQTWHARLEKAKLGMQGSDADSANALITKLSNLGIMLSYVFGQGFVHNAMSNKQAAVPSPRPVVVVAAAPKPPAAAASARSAGSPARQTVTPPRPTANSARRTTDPAAAADQDGKENEQEVEMDLEAAFECAAKREALKKKVLEPISKKLNMMMREIAETKTTSVTKALTVCSEILDLKMTLGEIEKGLQVYEGKWDSWYRVMAFWRVNNVTCELLAAMARGVCAYLLSEAEAKRNDNAGLGYAPSDRMRQTLWTSMRDLTTIKEKVAAMFSEDDSQFLALGDFHVVFGTRMSGSVGGLHVRRPEIFDGDWTILQAHLLLRAGDDIAGRPEYPTIEELFTSLEASKATATEDGGTAFADLYADYVTKSKVSTMAFSESLIDFALLLTRQPKLDRRAVAAFDGLVTSVARLRGFQGVIEAKSNLAHAQVEFCDVQKIVDDDDAEKNAAIERCGKHLDVVDEFASNPEFYELNVTQTAMVTEYHRSSVVLRQQLRALLLNKAPVGSDEKTRIDVATEVETIKRMITNFQSVQDNEKPAWNRFQYAVGLATCTTGCIPLILLSTRAMEYVQFQLEIHLRIAKFAKEYAKYPVTIAQLTALGREHLQSWQWLCSAFWRCRLFRAESILVVLEKLARMRVLDQATHRPLARQVEQLLEAPRQNGWGDVTQDDFCQRRIAIVGSRFRNAVRLYHLRRSITGEHDTYVTFKVVDDILSTVIASNDSAALGIVDQQLATAAIRALDVGEEKVAEQVHEIPQRPPAEAKSLEAKEMTGEEMISAKVAEAKYQIEMAEALVAEEQYTHEAARAEILAQFPLTFHSKHFNDSLRARVANLRDRHAEIGKHAGAATAITDELLAISGLTHDKFAIISALSDRATTVRFSYKSKLAEFEWDLVERLLTVSAVNKLWNELLERESYAFIDYPEVRKGTGRQMQKLIEQYRTRFTLTTESKMLDDAISQFETLASRLVVPVRGDQSMYRRVFGELGNSYERLRSNTRDSTALQMPANNRWVSEEVIENLPNWRQFGTLTNLHALHAQHLHCFHVMASFQTVHAARGLMATDAPSSFQYAELIRQLEFGKVMMASLMRIFASQPASNDLFEKCTEQISHLDAMVTEARSGSERRISDEIIHQPVSRGLDPRDLNSPGPDVQVSVAMVENYGHVIDQLPYLVALLFGNSNPEFVLKTAQHVEQLRSILHPHQRLLRDRESDKASGYQRLGSDVHAAKLEYARVGALYQQIMNMTETAINVATVKEMLDKLQSLGSQTAPEFVESNMAFAVYLIDLAFQVFACQHLVIEKRTAYRHALGRLLVKDSQPEFETNESAMFRENEDLNWMPPLLDSIKYHNQGLPLWHKVYGMVLWCIETMPVLFTRHSTGADVSPTIAKLYYLVESKWNHDNIRKTIGGSDAYANLRWNTNFDICAAFNQRQQIMLNLLDGKYMNMDAPIHDGKEEAEAEEKERGPAAVAGGAANVNEVEALIAACEAEFKSCPIMTDEVIRTYLNVGRERPSAFAMAMRCQDTGIQAINGLIVLNKMTRCIDQVTAILRNPQQQIHGVPDIHAELEKYSSFIRSQKAQYSRLGNNLEQPFIEANKFFVLAIRQTDRAGKLGQTYVASRDAWDNVAKNASDAMQLLLQAHLDVTKMMNLFRYAELQASNFHQQATGQKRVPKQFVRVDVVRNEQQISRAIAAEIERTSKAAVASVPVNHKPMSAAASGIPQPEEDEEEDAESAIPDMAGGVVGVVGDDDDDGKSDAPQNGAENPNSEALHEYVAQCKQLMTQTFFTAAFVKDTHSIVNGGYSSLEEKSSRMSELCGKGVAAQIAINQFEVISRKIKKTQKAGGRMNGQDEAAFKKACQKADALCKLLDKNDGVGALFRSKITMLQAHAQRATSKQKAEAWKNCIFHAKDAIEQMRSAGVDHAYMSGRLKTFQSELAKVAPDAAAAAAADEKDNDVLQGPSGSATPRKGKSRRAAAAAARPATPKRRANAEDDRPKQTMEQQIARYRADIQAKLAINFAALETFIRHDADEEKAGRSTTTTTKRAQDWNAHGKNFASCLADLNRRKTVLADFDRLCRAQSNSLAPVSRTIVAEFNRYRNEITAFEEKLAATYGAEAAFIKSHQIYVTAAEAAVDATRKGALYNAAISQSTNACKFWLTKNDIDCTELSKLIVSSEETLKGLGISAQSAELPEEPQSPRPTPPNAVARRKPPSAIASRTRARTKKPVEAAPAAAAAASRNQVASPQRPPQGDSDDVEIVYDQGHDGQEEEEIVEFVSSQNSGTGRQNWFILSSPFVGFTKVALDEINESLRETEETFGKTEAASPNLKLLTVEVVTLTHRIVDLMVPSCKPEEVLLPPYDASLEHEASSALKYRAVRAEKRLTIEELANLSSSALRDIELMFEWIGPLLELRTGDNAKSQHSQMVRHLSNARRFAVHNMSVYISALDAAIDPEHGERAGNADDWEQLLALSNNVRAVLDACTNVDDSKSLMVYNALDHTATTYAQKLEESPPPDGEWVPPSGDYERPRPHRPLPALAQASSQRLDGPLDNSQDAQSSSSSSPDPLKLPFALTQLPESPQARAAASAPSVLHGQSAAGGQQHEGSKSIATSVALKLLQEHPSELAESRTKIDDLLLSTYFQYVRPDAKQLSRDRATLQNAVMAAYNFKSDDPTILLALQKRVAVDRLVPKSRERAVRAIAMYATLLFQKFQMFSSYREALLFVVDDMWITNEAKAAIMIQRDPIEVDVLKLLREAVDVLEYQADHMSDLWQVPFAVMEADELLRYFGIKWSAESEMLGVRVRAAKLKIEKYGEVQERAETEAAAAAHEESDAERKVDPRQWADGENRTPVVSPRHGLDGGKIQHQLRLVLTTRRYVDCRLLNLRVFGETEDEKQKLLTDIQRNVERALLVVNNNQHEHYGNNLGGDLVFKGGRLYTDALKQLAMFCSITGTGWLVATQGFEFTPYQPEVDVNPSTLLAAVLQEVRERKERINNGQAEEDWAKRNELMDTVRDLQAFLRRFSVEYATAQMNQTELVAAGNYLAELNDQLSGEKPKKKPGSARRSDTTNARAPMPPARPTRSSNRKPPIHIAEEPASPVMEQGYFDMDEAPMAPIDAAGGADEPIEARVRRVLAEQLAGGKRLAIDIEHLDLSDLAGELTAATVGLLPAEQKAVAAAAAAPEQVPEPVDHDRRRLEDIALRWRNARSNRALLVARQLVAEEEAETQQLANDVAVSEQFELEALREATFLLYPNADINADEAKVTKATTFVRLLDKKRILSANSDALKDAIFCSSIRGQNYAKMRELNEKEQTLLLQFPQGTKETQRITQEREMLQVSNGLDALFLRRHPKL